jgi:DNA-binding transcriptional MocR family regulator
MMPKMASLRAERVKMLREGLEATEAILHERFPSWTWSKIDGGAALWVETGQDAVRLVEVAKRRSVRMVAGPSFSCYGAFRSVLRVPTWLPPEELNEGLDAIAE